MNRNINGELFKVLDAKCDINIADSFVTEQNKVKHGHGERKLFVGNKNDELISFFDRFEEPLSCFVLKTDLKKYLYSVKSEYMNPTQNYHGKDVMPRRYRKFIRSINQKTDLIEFELNKSNVNPPRVYLNAVGSLVEMRNSDWNIIRKIALPNITMISILKLKKEERIYYYFKLEKKELDGELIEDDGLETVEADDSLTPTEKKAVILARRGQGEYRRNLLKETSHCPFTLVDDESLLIASHIKPWKVGSNRERLDAKNGFVFTPTYDKMFDRGYITFDDDKKLSISPWLSVLNREKLNIEDGMLVDELPAFTEARKRYLKYHRKYVFRK